MKRLLLIIFTTLSLFSYGQDYEMLNLINIYRVKNGCGALIRSIELENIAKNQNNINILSDSVSHSHKTSEIALKGNSLPSTKHNKDKFIIFLCKYFDLEYIEPKTEKEVSTLTKLYSIYLFSTSKSHNNILLSKYNYIGFDFFTKNIEYKKNLIKIGNKEYKFNKFISYHKINYYVVIDFKK